MALIKRIGRVSIQEKKGHYYLRATLPQLSGGTKSVWLSTGLRLDTPSDYPLVESKAKDLDNDLSKWLIGISFPYWKWDNPTSQRKNDNNSLFNQSVNSSHGNCSPANQLSLTLSEVWIDFMQYQSTRLKTNTLCSYIVFGNALRTMAQDPSSFPVGSSSTKALPDDSTKAIGAIDERGGATFNKVSISNKDYLKDSSSSSPNSKSLPKRDDSIRHQIEPKDNAAKQTIPIAKQNTIHITNSFLIIDSGIGKRVKEWLILNRASHSVKLYLRVYKRAIDWAMQSEQFRHNLSHITINPFSDTSHEAVKRPSKPIDYFTTIERDSILEAFLSGSLVNTYSCNPHLKQIVTHTHYQYGLYCHLLFLTGCRLNEAAALRWSDIDFKTNQICFQRNIVCDTHTYSEQDSLKSQDYRLFPINKQLNELLLTIKDYQFLIKSSNCTHKTNNFPIKLCSNNANVKTNTPTTNIVSNGEDTTIETVIDDLLFKTVNGTLFKSDVFSDVWRKLLPFLGIRYRKPHCIRKTFITNCLEKGIPVATIASWVGNKPDVIYKHYSGVISIDVPEL